MIVSGSIIAIIGGLLIFSFIFSRIKCRTKVEATVSKIEVSKTPLRGTTVKQYTPVFTYMFKGNTYTVKADLLTHKKERFSIGQKLAVFVNPNNPEAIRFSHNLGFLFCGIVVALIGVLIIVLALM